MNLKLIHQIPPVYYLKNYRIPWMQKDEVNRQASGITESSVSDYHSPILLVPKQSTGGQKNDICY